MRSLDEARGILEREVQPLPPRRVPLEEALDCRLAASPRSDVNLPPGDVAAMDGYAVRHSDLALGRPLEIAFEVAAGTTPKTLPAGAAARIFTGALLPAGADSVVPQEQAALGAGGEVLLPPAAPGSHVRFRGEVVAVGDELAAIGDLVTPQMVAVLAAAGAANLEVVPRPATAAVVTGDELVGPGQTPGAGQIRDANGPLLAALVANAGLSKPARLRASDSRASLLETLALALDVAELVLTTGGVSVGTYDLVPAVVNELGGEVLVHRVRIKPGKPILVARFGHRWLVGLQGKPVSALVGWRMFGWPLARALAGDVGAFSEVPVNARLEEPALFMAETADILSRSKQTVILPDMAAGCSMADMAAIEQVDHCWETLGRILPVDETVMPAVYVNSAAVLKAFCGEHGGITCTSSNAKAVIDWSWARREKILFFPDEHLGRNTANKMGLAKEGMIVWDPFQPNGGNTRGAIQRAKLILWKGHCTVHQMFQPVHVDNFRKQYPEGKVIVHPECHEDVVNKADLSGSTEFIIKTVTAAPAGTAWAVGTELNLVNRLKRNLTDKKVFFLSSTVCQCATMFRVDGAHLCWAMENLVDGHVVNHIVVPDDEKHWARVALDRMMSVS